VLNLEQDSAECEGTETGEIWFAVDGGVGGFTYLWSNGATTDSVINVGAGLYTVSVSDLNACILDTSVTVFEADHFSVEATITSDYNGAFISCADSADAIVSLMPVGGTPTYFYTWISETGTENWSSGETTLDVPNLPAGIYRVDVRDLNDCRDSAEVVITEPVPLDYTVQVQDPLCYNESTGRIDLQLEGGTVYTIDDYEVWVNGLRAGRSVENLPQGTYAIRIEDLNDCFVEDEAELIHPDSLVLSFAAEDAFCKDKPDGQLSLDIEGGTFPYFISWDRGLPNNEEFFNDLLWGNYVATVTDGNNCVTVDTGYVDFTYASCLVIPNAFSPYGDGFNDQWIIEGLELYPNVDMRIFDRWGSRVYLSENAADEPWDGSFYGRELPIDSYHYVIDLNNDEPPITGNVTIVR
jgi:gliding motility-associated-like protein